MGRENGSFGPRPVRRLGAMAVLILLVGFGATGIEKFERQGCQISMGSVQNLREERETETGLRRLGYE